MATNAPVKSGAPVKYYLGVPTLRRYDTLRVLIDNALHRATISPEMIYIVDNGGSFTYDHPKVHIIRPPFNLGVAQSWNLLLTLVYVPAWDDLSYRTIVTRRANAAQSLRLPTSFPTPKMIISNDDLIVPDDGYERILAINSDIVFGNDDDNRFSLFCIDYRAYHLAGGFNGNIYPAYYEDSDFFAVFTSLGLQSASAGLNYNHVQSGTIKSYSAEEMDLHHELFRRNRAIYHSRHPQ